jgi:hypothetical protein
MKIMNYKGKAKKWKLEIKIEQIYIEIIWNRFERKENKISIFELYLIQVGAINLMMNMMNISSYNRNDQASKTSQK